MAEQLGFTQQQTAVIESRNKNLLVSAAAGSGKTTVMIQRVCDLIIKDKVPINKFLIISFTKASASDMKNKLIKKLSSLEPTPFILEQLDDIMTSDVSNLHSFCARLLKAYFYEVGLDPTFIVLDDIEVESCKERALTKLFNEKAESGDKEFYELVDIFSRSRKDTGLKRAILKLYNFLCSIVDRDSWFQNQLSGLYNLDLKKNTGAKILNLHMIAEKFRCEKLIEEVLEEANKAEEIKLVSYLQNLDSMFKLIRADSSFDDNARRLNNKERLPNFPKTNVGQELLYEKARKIKENVVERFSKLKEYSLSNNIEEVVEDLSKTKRRLIALYNLTKDFEGKFKALKKEKGGLDFNDLEQYTLKVLENPDILQEIKSKYEYVFVDEYQDINGVQEEILTRVSRENNRFMVGDVKQSIYRFRLCDPEIFLQKYGLYQKDKANGELHLLNANFRSKNSILEFVNAIFDDVMTEDFGGVDYKNEARLNAGKDSQKDEETRVGLLFADTKDITSKEDKEIEVYSVKEDNEVNLNIEKQGKSEGLMIAAKISDLITNKKIIDSFTKKPRKIKYSDITILTSSRTPFLNKIIQTLEEKNIPVSTDIEGDCLEDEYVFGLRSFIETINNYKVDLNLFSCLYSKAFGFTANELAEIKVVGNSNSFYYNDVLQALNNDKLSESIKVKLNNFFDLLNACREKSKFMSVRDIALFVVEAQNIKVKLSFEADYDKRIAKLNKFLSSLGEQTIVEYLGDQALSEVKCEPVHSGGSVQVMTIHKSKGLEFGVVFLVGINRGFNFKTIYSDIVISKDIGICLDYYDQAERYKEPTLARQVVKLVETKKMLEEEQRLLYVALTRATDYLYLVGSGNYEDIKTSMPPSPTCFLDFLGNMFVNPESYANAKFEVVVAEASELLSDVQDEKTRQVIFYNSDKIINNEINQIFNKKYKFEESKLQPLKMAVTELAAKDSDNNNFSVIYEEGEVSSLENGILQHKVMENLCLTENKEQVTKKISEMVERGIITQDETQNIMVKGISKLLKNDKFSSLITSAKVIMKEKEFYMLQAIDSNDSVLIQGIVDLLLITDNGLVIIDYKTGKLTENAVEKYRKQIELYAEAMERSYNLKVHKKYIASLNSGDLFELKK